MKTNEDSTMQNASRFISSENRHCWSSTWSPMLRLMQMSFLNFPHENHMDWLETKNRGEWHGIERETEPFAENLPFVDGARHLMLCPGRSTFRHSRRIHRDRGTLLQPDSEIEGHCFNQVHLVAGNETCNHVNPRSRSGPWVSLE